MADKSPERAERNPETIDVALRRLVRALARAAARSGFTTDAVSDAPSADPISQRGGPVALLPSAAGAVTVAEDRDQIATGVADDGAH